MGRLDSRMREGYHILLVWFCWCIPHGQDMMVRHIIIVERLPQWRSATPWCKRALCCWQSISPSKKIDLRGKICGDRRIILPPSIYINFKDVKSEHMHAFALPFQYRMNWYRWGWKREGKYAIALPLSRRSKFFVGTEGRWENKKDRASPPPLPRNIENYSAGEDKDRCTLTPSTPP